MRKAIWYRRAQAAAIVLLSATVVACAVFAAMYDRAVQQATTLARLADKPFEATGVRVVAAAADGPAGSLESLAAAMPRSLASAFERPVASSVVDLGVLRAPKAGPAAPMLWREGSCDHVTWRAGGCPMLPSQVAVSSADATRFGWRPDTEIRVRETKASKDQHDRSVTVSGVYDVVPGPYWFGLPLTGRSGTIDPDSGLLADYWLTAQATFTESWVGQFNEVDYPLDRGKVSVDEILRVGASLDDMQKGKPDTWGNPQATVVTALPEIASQVAREIDQGHVIVPLLLTQLALLGLLALWLVLSAAADQRRPEVALARLRGWGAAGARSLLLAELGPPVAAGLPLGFGAAVLMSSIARRMWLPDGVPFEVVGAVWWALGLAVVALTIPLVPVQRVSRQQVSTLLRSAVAIRSTWVPGPAEAMLLATAAAGFAAFAAGDLTGPFAMLVPGLLAVAVGVILARALAVSGVTIGRWLLARGRLAGGLSVLHIARRPGARVALTAVTVATALLVFSADALSVGARNRDYRAAAEVGAAVVVTTSGHDLSVVQAAVREADPTGRQLTAVATHEPANGGVTTMAVTPDEFRRIAQFPGQAPDRYAWGSLRGTKAPLVLKGTRLSLVVESTPMMVAAGYASSPAERNAVRLRAVLAAPDGRRRVAELAVLPADGSPPRRVSAVLPCTDGCLLIGVAFANTGDGPFAVVGECTIAELAVDGRPIPPAPARDWWSEDDGNGLYGVTASDGDRGGLRLGISTGIDATPELHHASVPREVPALVPTAPPPASLPDRLSTDGLDTVSRHLYAVGRVPFVPGSDPRTALVDASLIMRGGEEPAVTTATKVFFARTDPGAMRELRAALARRGLAVVSTDTVPRAREILDRSASAWSLQLGIVVGAAAVLLALLVLVLSVMTSWRSTARDHASLRMAGLSARHLRVVAGAEHLTVVALAVAAGVACGLIGAKYAMPGVPLFATPPTLDTLDLSMAWGVTLAAGLATLALLTITAQVAATWLLGRSTLERVREGS